MIGICAALASIPGSSRQAAPCCQFIIGGCFKFILEGANKLLVPGAEKLANMPELGKGELCPDLRKIRKEKEDGSTNSLER
jgi:hypothetical protein